LVGFLKAVFNATGEYRAGMPAEIKIGDSIVMIGDGGGRRETLPGFLYVYVEDVSTRRRWGRRVARETDGHALRRSTGNGARFLGQHLADRDAQDGLASPGATR
jgi:hypothetical protein